MNVELGMAELLMSRYGNTFDSSGRHRDGSSSFGFAWYYARWDARRQAEWAGFTDPANRCEEIVAFGNNLSAFVIWECTREI